MLENKYNIEFFQGSTFSLNLIVKNSDGSFKNLDSHSARMQIRPSYNSSTVTESLTTTNNEITINTTSSVLSLSLPANRTANIAVDLNSGNFPPRSKYVYDLELIDSATNVTKLLFGEVTVFGEVTR